MYVYDDTKLTEIFCKVDDYYQAYARWACAHSLAQGGKARRGPQGQLFPSEVMTILIFYHLSGFKCFKYYYKRLVLGLLKREFPQAPSYERFVSLIDRACLPLYGWILLSCQQAQRTGIYYIDSTKLPVCHIRRTHSHRVFKGIAQRGKTSVGWFFGLKLHLVINEKGELICVRITSGNVADNNPKTLKKLLQGLKGKCFGDKGYLTRLFAQLIEQGLHLFTKVRKNMKNKLIKLLDKRLLKSRSLIETVIDILKHICDIDHSRHRKPSNAITHLLAGVAAYTFLDQKPSIYKNDFSFKFLLK